LNITAVQQQIPQCTDTQLYHKLHIMQHIYPAKLHIAKMAENTTCKVKISCHTYANIYATSLTFSIMQVAFQENCFRTPFTDNFAVTLQSFTISAHHQVTNTLTGNLCFTCFFYSFTIFQI